MTKKYINTTKNKTPLTKTKFCTSTNGNSTDMKKFRQQATMQNIKHY